GKTKTQPTAAARRAQFRSAVKLVFTAGACMAAMVLIVVPLLTLEADGRGGGGGGRGGGGGDGGGGGGGAGGTVGRAGERAAERAQGLADMAAGAVAAGTVALAGTAAE